MSVCVCIKILHGIKKASHREIGKTSLKCQAKDKQKITFFTIFSFNK